MSEPKAAIGVVGGSGFYELLDGATGHDASTPFGSPSHPLTIGDLAGRDVAFIPRHGPGHRLPPHRIPYRANLWALKRRGVERVLLPCAVGSLRSDLAPGTFVVLDQIVDRTRRRSDTFFDGPESPDTSVDGYPLRRVTHVSLADPYCAALREEAVSVMDELGLPHAPSGTIVVIEGPHFSTRAESRSFAGQGWDVVGMTQAPEVPLARELQLCTLGIALVTDYDAGLDDDPDVPAVSVPQVLEIMRANIENLRRFLETFVPRIPSDRACDCGDALDGAQLGG